MSFWFTTVHSTGGKRAAFSFVHFYIINWFKLFDFVGSARWNFDFFVHTNATVKCRKNLHVAPPWCLKSIPSRASSRYTSKFDFAMVAQVHRVLWLFAYFAWFVLVRPNHAGTTAKGFVANLYECAFEIFAVFRAIYQSRTHMGSISGECRWFWWKSTISRFRFSGWVRHRHQNVRAYVIFVDLWLVCQSGTHMTRQGCRFCENSDDFPISVRCGSWGVTNRIMTFGDSLWFW